MMQRFDTCKTLCFWHEFTKEILDENDLKQLQYAQWQKQIKMTTSNFMHIINLYFKTLTKTVIAPVIFLFS